MRVSFSRFLPLNSFLSPLLPVGGLALSERTAPVWRVLREDLVKGPG